MNAFTAILLLLLPFATPAAAQVVINIGAPPDMPAWQMTQAQLAEANAAWQRHIADNQLKIERGETGQLTITVKARDDQPLPARLQVQISEHVPDHQKPGPFLVETHHFVRFGTVVLEAEGKPALDGKLAAADKPGTEGKLVVSNIPIGLMLEVEVWPADDSAPHASFSIAGPGKRGDQVSLETKPALPFPVLTGRLLDSNGLPVCHRDVALELRTASLPYQLDVHTDIAGRFRATLGVAPTTVQLTDSKLPPTTITITMAPGKLIRKGNYRFWTTEMPTGVCATKETTWPTQPVTDIGDLQLGK